MRRVLVIVPAYNEAGSLPALIRALAAARMPEPWALDVVVVSDGSTDNTAEVVAGLPARLIALPCNLGVGGAVQTGLQYAAQHGYQFAMQVDGDGQHPPEQIPLLLTAMAEGGFDMVLGSRFAPDHTGAAGSSANRVEGFQSSATRRVGIRLFAWTLSAICGQRLTDSTSGFRLWNRRAIELLAEDYPEDYPEVEAILKLHQAGLRMKEVPVRMASRTAGESSIGALQALIFLVKVPLALLMSVGRGVQKSAVRTQKSE